MKNPPRIILGTQGPWWNRKTITLGKSDVASHMHVSGITGSGKSRFLASLFLQMHAAGLPATLIDPHGDLCRLILHHLAAEGFYGRPDAFADLIYLDLPSAAAQGRYIPFNVLKQARLPGPAIEGNVLDAMHRSWPSLSGGNAPRFDKLIQRGVRVLRSNNLPLPFLELLLSDPTLRDHWLANEPDVDTVNMFRNQFDRLSPKDQVDYADSTLSRISHLTQDPVLKYSLLAEDNFFDFRRIMDEGKSLLVDLSVRNSVAQRLLGSFLTVAAEQGAKSRAEIRSTDRGKSHHLFIDEFQLFVAQSAEALTAMLSETRKFGMFAVLSHQNWSQIPDRLRGGLENCRVDIALAQGAMDAEYSARMLMPVEARTVRQRGEDDADESIGLREQWEQGRQDLADQWQGEAFVSIHRLVKPTGFLHHFQAPHPRKLEHVKVPYLPDPKVDSKLIEAVETEYIRRYFRAPVEREVPRVERPARQPPVKRRTAGRAGR